MTLRALACLLIVATITAGWFAGQALETLLAGMRR